MLKESWKIYLKAFKKDIQDKVEWEIREGLSNEAFSSDDLDLWTMNDFIIFVKDVESFYSPKKKAASLITYRVIFDYGNVEVSVWVQTSEVTEEKIKEAAMDELIRRDFGLGPEIPTIVDISATPEWDEDETVSEWCSHCGNEVELPADFKEHTCPNCNEKILPCSQCLSQNCGNCPLLIAN